MAFYRSSLKGRGRGRGNRDIRRGPSSTGAWSSRTLPIAPSGPFGTTIDSIDIKSLLIEENSPEISNVEYIASYNWLDGQTATILVPGE
jgi:hypothetical protein